MTREGVLKKDIIVPGSSPNSQKTLKRGRKVYTYHGHNYGLIPSGIHVTTTPNEPPIYDIPASIIEWI